MESLLLFLAIFTILGFLACELSDAPAPTSSSAAGPLSPPPPPHQEAGPPRRIRRALARSRSRFPPPPPAPVLLPPSAAPFASSTPVLTWAAWRRNPDRKPIFLDEAEEVKHGRMYRDLDPILGWRWRAFPKGTYEARSQQLHEDRKSNIPAGQVELETQSPATVPAPPPPTIRAPAHDTSVLSAIDALAGIPTLPLGLPWAGPTSQPPLQQHTVVELQAAPAVRTPTFSEQFAGLCAATQHIPLPWPSLSFAEQFALSCQKTQHLPLPFPLPSLPPPPPMVQESAPAPCAAPPALDFGFASADPTSTSRSRTSARPPAGRARTGGQRARPQVNEEEARAALLLKQAKNYLRLP